VIPDDLSPLWISLETSSAATALAFLLGIGVAVAVHRYTDRRRGLIDGVLTLPLVLPPTVVGFFLLLVFGRRSAIGQMLQHVGIRIAFSWPATVIAATVVAFPLMYRATLGGFEQVNPNFVSAARTLGASEWRTFSRILLPLARPAVMAGVVLTFARALGEFGATLMLAGNIPGRTQTMPVAIFFAADGGDMRHALSWVVLIVILSLVTIAALNYCVPRQSARQKAMNTSGRTPERLVSQPAILARGSDAGHPVASKKTALTVEVRKSYPGFRLSAAFSTANGALGLLGASGSGKSMTLRCIAGLEKPEKGRIVLNGRVLLDTRSGINLSPAERRVGMVFQDYALFPHLTVRENIGFSLHAHTAEKRNESIAYWSRMMQIDTLLSSYPGELSGGQRQRVALARALAMEPEVLLLDEPLSALDHHLRRQVEEQLREALAHYRGVTILVTHDRDEAFRSCEDLVVLSEGSIAACGPKHEIFANPQSLAVARLTGCKNIARIRHVGAERIHVEEWRCTLRALGVPPDGAEYIGIRAHDIRILKHADTENTFPCWLVASIESPFETTLYLRLHEQPEEGDRAQLEAEIPRGEWAELSAEPQPWRLVLDPALLIFLKA
jgi:molybdate transport system permease protein